MLDDSIRWCIDKIAVTIGRYKGLALHRPETWVKASFFLENVERGRVAAVERNTTSKVIARQFRESAGSALQVAVGHDIDLARCHEMLRAESPCWIVRRSRVRPRRDVMRS